MAKTNKWFDKFLDSFETGQYQGQYGYLKKWQYKNLMDTARRNNWKMVTSRQLDVFMSNIKMQRATWEQFGTYETDAVKCEITVSNTTGFATIRITHKAS